MPAGGVDRPRKMLRPTTTTTTTTKHNSVPLLAEAALPALHQQSPRVLLMEVVRSSVVGCTIATTYGSVLFGLCWLMVSYVVAWQPVLHGAGLVLDVVVVVYTVATAVLLALLSRKLCRKRLLHAQPVLKEQVLCMVVFSCLLLALVTVAAVRVVVRSAVVELSVWLHSIQVVAMVGYEWLLFLFGLLLGGSLGVESIGPWFVLWRCAVVAVGAGSRIALYFEARPFGALAL